jgi:hypothetical protein
LTMTVPLVGPEADAVAALVLARRVVVDFGAAYNALDNTKSAANMRTTFIYSPLRKAKLYLGTRPRGGDD